MGALCVMPFLLIVIWAGIEQHENEKENKLFWRKTMLKTNSKKAKENIISYIKKYALDALAEYGITPANNNEMLAAVWMICKREKNYIFASNLKSLINQSYKSDYEIFREWAQGLAMDNLFCYYYNRSAADDLAAILEETPTEAAAYTETDAEEMLTRLIFREVINGYTKTAM